MTTTPETQPLEGARGRVFYGWQIVAALFAMLAFSSGFGFYNQSVLLRALTAERGFAVGAASLATTIFFAVSGFTGLGIAVLVERYDARLSIVVGVAVSALALVLIGRVDQLWQLYLAFALFGVGFAGINQVTGTTLITRWFHRRRSLALAIAATGLSFGGIALTPLAARLIDRVELTRATPILALLLALGILPITLWRLRDRPSVLGLEPDGRIRVSPGIPDTETPLSVDFPVAIRSRFFVFVTAAFFFGLMGQVGGIAHQFKLISDQTDSEIAALGVSILAGSSVVGRLLVGWLLTWVPTRLAAIVLALAQSSTLFLFGRAEGVWTLLLTSSFFGLTVGSFLLMRPLLLAEAFGIESYARIYSLNNLLTSLGVAIGPAMLGLAYDGIGGYPAAYTLAAAASILGGLCLMSAGATATAAAPSDS